MPVQVGLTELKDLDKAVLKWLRKAYEENK
jgi:hypothetical protein